MSPEERESLAASLDRIEVKGTLRVGDDGEGQCATITVAGSRQGLILYIEPSDDRGSLTTFRVGWPECTDLALLVAAEISSAASERSNNGCKYGDQDSADL